MGQPRKNSELLFSFQFPFSPGNYTGIGLSLRVKFHMSTATGFTLRGHNRISISQRMTTSLSRLLKIHLHGHRGGRKLSCQLCFRFCCYVHLRASNMASCSPPHVRCHQGQLPGFFPFKLAADFDPVDCLSFLKLLCFLCDIRCPHTSRLFFCLLS